ncbi:hypothetical protein GQX73_g5269 [Xylaria multiplex]|uniref:Uncharacterized protein n=1 Tax=Xylaria multiplex TaxID=323545 RepID=A0A7C8IUL3_9PEZI|nr:hypothetical protein GQX73_g5269 [Xylaria multiplex]
MSLLRLPPETLAQIFDYIGSSFFHEDLGRLAVCKQWFEFALPACFKCVTISQEILRSLITSEAMRKPSPLKRSLETLDLELRGCHYPYSSTAGPQDNAQESDVLNRPASNEALDGVLIKTWINVLNEDLAQLAIIAQQSHRLRTLRIRARSSSSPDSLDDPEDYLSLRTVQGFLSVENLSVLVLDLSICPFNPSGEQGGDLHICPTIGSLLHTLRTLHLRMHSICPDVLKPQVPDDNLKLSVMVINLSLITNEPGITSAAHSKRCGSPAGGLLQLKADIQEQAEALTARMTSPKIMRVLTHSLPQFEIQSLDVLTGKIMMLEDDMAWDEDGKMVMEESEPESEFPDDEFSSFSDD